MIIKLNEYKVILILIVLLGGISVNPWSPIIIGNTFTSWALYLVILISFLWAKKLNHFSYWDNDYKIVSIFLLWTIVGIMRGCYVAENYWEYKNLVSASFILLFPLIVYAFQNPLLVQRVYNRWLLFGLIAYVVFFYWMVNISQFYLGPIYFVACFFPLIPKRKWKFIVLVLVLLLLTYEYQDKRSQFIKAAVSIIIAVVCYLKSFVYNWIIKTIHWSCYVAPIVLLALGISGVFNVFEDVSEKDQGQNVLINSNGDEVSLSADTRTFIYNEVLSSAIDNHYVFLGRTPARGNDTSFFYDLADDMLTVKFTKNIKHERSQNELCFLNIFTWLGLIGMLLYIAIYLRASYMGVYRSKNFYVKMAGVVTAFNFAYGWIENSTAFDILNLVYWTFISICLSSKFRNMSNSEFESWYKEIFCFNQRR